MSKLDSNLSAQARTRAGRHAAFSRDCFVTPGIEGPANEGPAIEGWPFNITGEPALPGSFGSRRGDRCFPLPASPLLRGTRGPQVKARVIDVESGGGRRRRF